RSSCLVELASDGSAPAAVLARPGLTMTSSGDVIVQVAAGGGPLLRTVDSILRQRVTPASIALVKPDILPTPLVRSAAGRLSAIVLDGGPYPGVSLNAAVRSGQGQYIVVLRAGLGPDRVCTA